MDKSAVGRGMAVAVASIFLTSAVQSRGTDIQARLATDDGREVTVTYTGCVRTGQALVCSVVVLANGSSAASLRLNPTDTYAVDVEGTKYIPAELLSGGQSITPPFNILSFLNLNLLPDVPVTVRARFANLAASVALQAFVVSSSGNNGTSIVFPEAAFSPTPIASQTKSGIRVDLLGCERAALRVNCTLGLSNVGPRRVGFRFPTGVMVVDHSTFLIDQSNRKYGLVERVVSGEPAVERDGVFLDPGVTIRGLIKISNVDTDVMKGALTVGYYPHQKWNGSPEVVTFPDITLSAPSGAAPATPGVTIRSGSWLVTVSGCEGLPPVLTCVGKALNGAERNDTFNFDTRRSYAVFGEEQVPVLMVSVGDVNVRVVHVDDPNGPRIDFKVDGGKEIPFHLYFGNIRAMPATATVVLDLSSLNSNLGYGNSVAAFKNVSVKIGRIVSNVPPQGKAADTPARRSRPVTPDAEAARLQKVLATSSAPADRQAAALRLWQRYGDANAKAKLAAMARQLLDAITTTPVGRQVCAVSGDPALCARFSSLMEVVGALGEPTLVKSVVDNAASGRVPVAPPGRWFSNQGTAERGILNFGPAASPYVMDALRREREIRAQLESAGWKPEAINRQFNQLLEVCLNLAWMADHGQKTR